MAPAVLDLSALTPRLRARVQRTYADAERQAREDRALAAAYEAAKGEHGCVNALDVVAEDFTRRWGFRVTPSRVRVARWGK